jgi:hypothetical protein
MTNLFLIYLITKYRLINSKTPINLFLINLKLSLNHSKVIKTYHSNQINKNNKQINRNNINKINNKKINYNSNNKLTVNKIYQNYHNKIKQNHLN